MDFPVKRRKVQILDYFGTIESNAEKCQALSDEARRDSIRATCNICQKPISGTFRVKSNFVTHLRKSHPEAYIDYQLKTGRFNLDDSGPNLSISSLDEPNHMSMMRSYLPPPMTHSSPMLAGGDNFGSLIPRHMPTSTVKDHSSASSPVGNLPEAMPVKVELDGTVLPPARTKTLSPQQSATEALMDFIIGDMMSLKLVESPRFVRFLQLVNSAYHLPSLKEVTDVINNTHARHKTLLSDKLKSVSSLYVSRELWTTSDPQVKLATFSIHYIENWSFQHQLISSCHNGKSLIDEESWREAQDKSLAEIVENADVLATLSGLTDVHHLPGFLSAAKVTEKSGSADDIYVGQKGYAALLDEAVVSSLLQSDQSVLDTINKIANLLTTTEVDWSCDVSNCTSYPWFEQLRLLDMVLSMENSLKEQVTTSSSSKPLLTADDIILMSKVIEVLRPFQEVAERVRNPNTVTCSLAFASIMLLKAALKDYEEAYPNFQLLTELKREFYEATKSIDDGESNVYTTATILDPRFKLQWCDLAKQSHFKKAFIEVVKNSKISKPDPVDTKEIKMAPFQSNGFFTRILKQQPESLQVGTITSEVLRYLDEPLMQEDCDVLGYWQANGNNFPNLSLLAQQYLAMPTSVSSTSGFFDLQGQVLSIKSTLLFGDILQKVVELRPSFKH